MSVIQINKTGISEFRTSFWKLFLLILMADICKSSYDLLFDASMITGIFCKFCDIVTKRR